MKVHHIGLAVDSIDETARHWEKLGLKIEHREIVESQSVEVAFLSLGNVWLELIQPAAEKTPITNFLRKRGNALHHICFEVEEMGREAGSVGLISQPVKGFGDSRICFSHPREFGGILLEFVEKAPY